MSNLPLVSGSLITIVIGFYLLNFAIPNASEYLGLVTANTVLWNKYVWNVLTAVVYEESLPKVLIDVICIAMAAPTKIDYLPYDQFGLYMVVSSLLTTLSTSFYCIIRFFSTSREAMVLEPIYGCSGLIMTLVMYSRKHLGKTPVIAIAKTGGSLDYFIIPITQLTYNNMPVVMVSALLLCWFLRLRFLALDAPFAICSCVISWAYLKFYYRNEDGSFGTPASEFAFVHMFPEPLHVVMGPLSTAFYNIVVLVGLFPELPKAELPSYTSSHHLRGPHISEFAANDAFAPSPVRAPGSAAPREDSRVPTGSNSMDEEAPVALALPAPDALMERRKAKALKMLDAKMMELSRAPASTSHD